MLTKVGSVVLQAGPAGDARSGDVRRDRGGHDWLGNDFWFAPSAAASFDTLEEGEEDEQRYNTRYNRDGD